jgi:hypothetical protein
MISKNDRFVSEPSAVFPNFPEMVRGLQLDKNNWVNREALRFIRRRSFETTKQLARHYPEHLRLLKYSCENGHEFTPEWLKKCFPTMPVYYDNGLLQPTQCQTQCPICDVFVNIPLPIKQHRGDISFYGDEAFRVLTDLPQEKQLITFSIVSRPMVRSTHDEFINDFNQLKIKYFASLDAQRAPLHMRRLWNKEARKRGVYKMVSDNDKFRFCEGLGRLIKKYHDSIFIYNCTSIVVGDQRNRKVIDFNKANAFYPLIIRVIEECTNVGLAVRFFLETAEKDGWARNLFLGGQLTLMWPFVSHGLPVAAPEFVTRNSSEYLQIADFVSFIVARYIARRSTGESVDLDPKILGSVRYQGFKEDGSCIARDLAGYPWDTFFRGTSWIGL